MLRIFCCPKCKMIAHLHSRREVICNKCNLPMIKLYMNRDEYLSLNELERKTQIDNFLKSN